MDRQLPYSVVLHHRELGPVVFGVFETLREAKSFCKDWRAKDDEHVYEILGPSGPVLY